MPMFGRNANTAVSRGRKSNASPVRISRVLLYAETEVSVPPPSSKSSLADAVYRSRLFTPRLFTRIGVVTSFAFGGVKKLLNGFASSLRGITKYNAWVRSFEAAKRKSAENA